MDSVIPISDRRNSSLGKRKITRMEEGKNMDDLLKSYIEKVDRDQSELREDVRESERRTEKKISEFEYKLYNRFIKIVQILNSQNDIIDDVKQTVNDKMEEEKKYRHSNNIAIVIGVVSTVVAMIGIYYATISTITSILGIAK